MIKYIHTFRVSSGKDYKVVTKVYTGSLQEARENLLLLGGKLEQVEVVTTWESN